MPVVSVCIDVSNIEIANNFYTEVLGCRIKEKKDKSTELESDNVVIYLMERDEGSNPLIHQEAARSYSRHWTPVHLDFHVSHIERLIELLVKLGGTLEEKKAGNWGQAAFCSDPFGNGFCMIELNSSS